jgi:ATP-binding cassette subfamily B multidrug efflux pump
LRSYLIEGGYPLTGHVKIGGSKNASLAVLSAAMVIDGPCIIDNLPAISDIDVLLQIFSDIGATVEYLAPGKVRLDARTINTHEALHSRVTEIRGSYYLLGALLGRFGKVSLRMPGGCDFGVRPIDLHLKGFQALGATTDVGRGIVTCSAEELTGGGVFLDTVSVGATINIMLAAVKAKGKTVIDNAAREPHIVVIAASLITVIGSLVMMFRMSVSLSFTFLALVPITVLFTIYRIKKTRPLFRKRSKKLGKMNGYVEEILFGQKTIAAYRKESFFTEEFHSINEEASDAHYRADYQAALNGPSVTLISNLSLALVGMIGVSLFLKGSFTIGVLTSFILYSRRFSGPINEIAAIIAELQSGLSAAERVFTLLEQPPEPPDAEHALPLEDVRGVVEFDRVSFAYTPDQPVIRDFSVKTNPGELFAIVGSTGAGKTTLINLLMRFYDPQEGEILIDGKRLLDITRDSLRRSFAMVLQDTWLFQGTIRDNIAYGKPDATLEEIEQAAKAAHIASYIESLPNGYDSIISDSASNLSQGQKQLMTIARAMLLDTPMLILDEATSNVDSQTEIMIQDAMNKLVQGRTSFVIAHRLSTVRNADQILLLSDGQIVEQGTHEELLEKGEVYADLYQAQFS